VGLGLFEQTNIFGSRYKAQSLLQIIIMPKATIIKLVPSIFMPVFLPIVNRNFAVAFD
jgi:hypothetical protein